MSITSKAAVVKVEEIRTSRGYGNDAIVKVKITHPLFQGSLVREVKRGELKLLYERLAGPKRRVGSLTNDINASNVGILASLIDGAHMNLAGQAKMTVQELGFTTPKDMKEVEESLGSDYIKNRDIRLVSKPK